MFSVLQLQNISLRGGSCLPILGLILECCQQTQGLHLRVSQDFGTFTCVQELLALFKHLLQLHVSILVNLNTGC